MPEEKRYRWGIEENLDGNPIRHRIVTVTDIEYLLALVRYMVGEHSERANEIVIVREDHGT